jgi:uncharacterized protein (TIGR03790 family)
MAAALLLLAATGLQPAQLAVVVNDADPDSVAIARNYQESRAIPDRNIIHVRIAQPPRKLDRAGFRLLKADIDRQLPDGTRAVLFAWTSPYAVECNALTAAFSLGFDADQCRRPCGPGNPHAWYDGRGRAPFILSMLLPGPPEQAAKLVKRTPLSGFMPPPATAYYLTTPEIARNVRVPLYPPEGTSLAKRLQVRHVEAAALEGMRDIMVYQLGAARVAKLDTVAFQPGALADHLTSLGGDLLGEGQMSSLRWLEAGASASYGTVSEPCNYWQKFPHPAVLLKHYLNGDTAVEAYWKSVAWATQGLFIGDPLAAPYRRK